MLDNKSKAVLEFVNDNPSCSSKEIHDGLSTEVAYATIKRVLTKLMADQLIQAVGKGKGTKYIIDPAYGVFIPIDVDTYFAKEIDEREAKNRFDLLLIPEVLGKVNLFPKDEEEQLNGLQAKYKANISELNEAEYKRELERLAIDLSWKSAQIEGNTYSLLETEQLLKQQGTAKGRTKDEAVMLLDHKDALDLIIEDPSYLSPMSVAKIESIHSILTKDLGVDRNIRKRRVGISGTNYKPLDNEFQIREALEDMCNLVNAKENVFEKALHLLVLISYIQAFSDGNKRTARIMSNAILMSNGYCPISFRTVDPIEYKKAMLLFYEQNNIMAFKKIFIEQFEFAVNTYF